MQKPSPETSTTPSKPGWGAIVEGEPFDLADWADGLRPPFDPSIEIYEGETVLRSKVLDELTSADEVYNRALAYIERLNGAFALSQRTKPVRLRAVIHFAADGKKHRTLFVGTGVIESRGRARAYSASIGPDGKPLAPPPSQVQRWAAVAQDDELLDDALMYFAKGANWFDIYKALECLCIRAGGESDFLALGWEPERDVLRLKRTANWARHTKQKFKPPDNPMPIKEGRDLLSRLLRRALDVSV
jgi:hypothetical protein